MITARKGTRRGTLAQAFLSANLGIVHQRTASRLARHPPSKTKGEITVNTNQTNIRRTIVLPVARTEESPQVTTTNGSFPGPEAKDMPIRFPRCVRARSPRRSRGWRNTGRNSAA